MDPKNFKKNLFLLTPDTFDEAALLLFGYQWQHNPVYHQYCRLLHKEPSNVHSVEDIPFLPIEFFKTHQIQTGQWAPQTIFMSSGTSGQVRSQVPVSSLDFYHQVAQYIFEQAYGPLHQWEILALLPSYLEQGQSSLVSMVQHFLTQSQPTGGFLMQNLASIVHQLHSPTPFPRLVIGVTYAMLDLSSLLKGQSITHTVFMETGGMKGRRKEMIRTEVHQELKSSFGVSSIHSEYGMSELTSQAYGADGRFRWPDWCRTLVRDVNDPFAFLACGKTGGLNIIDLANVDTCAFIETKDLGKVYENGDFEVLGRFDNADIRGCNLMVE